MRHLLNTIAHVFAATMVMVLVSNLLSLQAFGTATVLGTMALSAGLSVSAVAALFVVSAIAHFGFRVRQAGFVLMTALGTLAGATALAGFGYAAPALVNLSFLSAIPFALANTLLIWALGISTGTVKLSQLKMWPE